MEYESDKSIPEDEEGDGEEKECEDADRDDALTIATSALDSTIGDGLARSPEESYAR